MYNKNGRKDETFFEIFRGNFCIATPISSSTSSPGITQRTVVFVYKGTSTGQDMFVLGGIDQQIRPGCTGVTNAEISPCAISIEVR
jgi:hypothetical protein